MCVRFVEYVCMCVRFMGYPHTCTWRVAKVGSCLIYIWSTHQQGQVKYTQPSMYEAGNGTRWLASKMHGACLPRAPPSSCRHPPHEPSGATVNPTAHWVQVLALEQALQLAGQASERCVWLVGARFSCCRVYRYMGSNGQSRTGSVCSIQPCPQSRWARMRATKALVWHACGSPHEPFDSTLKPGRHWVQVVGLEQTSQLSGQTTTFVSSVSGVE